MYGGPNAVTVFNFRKRNIVQWRTLSEYTQREFYNEQQNTSTRSKSEDLWYKSFVKRCGTFFPEDGDKRGVCPVVLRSDTRRLRSTLNTRFYNLR